MNEDLTAIADNRARIINEIPLSVSMESFRFYAWAIKGLIGFAILATLWYARVEYKFSAYDERFFKRGPLIDANTEYRSSNNIVNLGALNTMNGLRDRLGIVEGRVNKIELRTNEMWFLKEHGIPNNEDFYQKKGYRAPPENTPDEPDPRPSP